MKVFLAIVLIAITAYALCKLTKKMGHHPLIGLFFFIPGLNIVMLYILASGKWPIEYERDALLEENKRLKTGK